MLAKGVGQMKFDGKSIARAGIIAGVYAGLCLLLAPISYRVFQVRVAEALTVLPIVWPEAVIGLACGALIANVAGPLGVFDVVFGTAATAIAAWLTYRFRNSKMAYFFPIIVNGIVVGTYVPFLVGMEIHLWTIPATMLLVAAGEGVAVFALGVPLLNALRRTGMIE
jgi:uncharacterized membrane protein